jgi:hypothetical protein
MRYATKGALSAALKGVKAGQKVLLVATALNEKAHMRSSRFALLQVVFILF